jgi:hypothetical protein
VLTMRTDCVGFPVIWLSLVGREEHGLGGGGEVENGPEKEEGV